MNQAKTKKFAAWTYKRECVGCEILVLLVEESGEQNADALPVDPGTGAVVCKVPLDHSRSGGGGNLAAKH